MKKVLMTAVAAALIAGTFSVAQAKKVEDMNVDITGLAQLGYMAAQSAAVPNNDSFTVNRLRIKLAAQPADKVKFNGALEVGKGGFGANGTGLFPTPDSRIVDAFVTLSYLDWATIKIGQMPSPVSYELGADEYGLETINYSQLVGNMVNRDRGAAIIIPVTDVVGLSAWILNGEGAIDGATAAIDDSPAYGAMINVKPVKDLSFKAWGNFNSFKNDGAALNALPGLGGTFTAGRKSQLKADAYGIGGDYKIAGFHFMGEYAADTLKAKDTVGSIGSLKQREYVIHVSYEIPQTNLQLVARYDKWDPNKTVKGDESKITTLGFNWNFEKDARLQVMEELKSETPSVKNNTTMVQLSVRF